MSLNAIRFIPLMLATFALAYASFKAKGEKRGLLIIAFIIWLSSFFWTLGVFG